MAAIKDIIANVIHDMSAGPRRDLAALWQEICPQGTQVVDLREGVALIHVDSSARLVHLNARRGALLKTIQAQCPQVKQLRFKVGKITPQVSKGQL